MNIYSCDLHTVLRKCTSTWDFRRHRFMLSKPSNQDKTFVKIFLHVTTEASN